jgi:hypothetical protein
VCEVCGVCGVCVWSINMNNDAPQARFALLISIMSLIFN